MRKSLLALGFLLGISHCVSAQRYILVVPVNAKRAVLHYGVYGLWQSSHYRADSSPDYTFRNDGSRTGGGAGVFMDLFLSRHVAFTVGLNTSSRGGKFAATYRGKEYSFTPSIPSVSASYDLKTRYAYLPLGLKLFTNEILPHTCFYAEGLFAVGSLTSATNYGNDTNTLGRRSYKYQKQLDFTDIEASIGVGTEIRLLEKLNAFASVRYHRGLNSAQNTPLDFVSTNNFFPKTNAYPLRNTTVGLQFGLIFVPYRGEEKSRAPQPSQPDGPPIRSAYQPAPLPTGQGVGW